MQQLKPLTLRRNFSWTFTGNLVYAASQWGMLVLLAKLGSPEMVGQFTLGLAVTAPVIMFTNLQLRAIQATDAKQQYVFADYLGLRLIGTGLALLIIAGITLKAGYRWETSLVILAIALAKAFESISDVFYGLIQQHERMDRIAIALMIKGPLSLLFLGLGVHLTGSVLGGAVGLAVAWAIVLIACDIRNGALILNNSQKAEENNFVETGFIASEFGEHSESTENPPPPPPCQGGEKIQNQLLPRWHWKTLGKLIWLALPLGFVMMLISLNTNIPRYFIERYLGERQLGIFAAMSYLMVVGQMVVSALAESASPRLAKYYAAGNTTAFRTLLFKLVGVGAALGGAGVLVAVVAGREILTLLYRPEYGQQADLFVWLMVAAGMGYMSSFLGYGMTAARYFRVQMPLFALVTGSSAIACLWLIPTMGVRGAAIALIVGAVVQASFSLGAIAHAIYKLDRYTERK
ncbi:oligosaccharide flippase family protein [Microcoleus sp. ARI1-B5]|uniref:lipopolysaccharide biosynthesis protein n=1 Tax=unclassified Microcoleus TaxID=2642155 RepID=UPI002FD1597E